MRILNGAILGVLGINDSHDAGAAVSNDCGITEAVNEERFTKRKNDVGFPFNSIKWLLKNSDDIDAVALGWIGGNALVSRVFPKHDIRRREIWRKQLPKQSRASMHMSNFVYRITQNQTPKIVWKTFGDAISRNITAKRLRSIDADLSKKKIYMVEHHLAHAASAYYPSGFKEALVITIDGAGDGLSGSVSIGDNGNLKRLAEFRASASLGLFYGAATVACDLRFSEDEGKLMSLAAYSYPQKIEELKDICYYDAKQKRFISKHGTRYELLLAEYMKDHMLSRYEREAFAYAVQRHAEEQLVKLVNQWIKETGIHNVAVSGGFFSNVIANMVIEALPEVKNFFVFPHMGDGGLSAGAAMYVDFMLNQKYHAKRMESAYLGPSYTNIEIEDALKSGKRAGKKIVYEEIKDPAKYGAELVGKKNEIILWFHGKMEFGPRALGNRSVIALPNKKENRDTINLIIKKRPYYQPFASTILEEKAGNLLDDYKRADSFMTGANRIKPEHYEDLVAAAHIDHTTRPQILKDENPIYRELIQRIEKETGIAAVLNTSLNKHGRPIVLDPADAIWTLENTGAQKLIIGNYLVEKKG